jgi:hypothetical protein
MSWQAYIKVVLCPSCDHPSSRSRTWPPQR